MSFLVSQFLSHMSSETCRQGMEAIRNETAPAAVHVHNSDSETDEHESESETDERESETVCKNESEPPTIHLQSNDSETNEQKGENNNSEYAEENNTTECAENIKSEFSEKSEKRQLRSRSSNVVKTNTDKSEHSDLETKGKIKTFKVGQIVFATLKPKATKKSTNLIYYAGIIVDGKECYLKKPKENCAWVYWFLTKNVSMVPTEYIIDFAPNLKKVKGTIEAKVNVKYRERHIQAVRDAINVYATRWNKTFSQTSFNKACSQFLKEYKKGVKYDDYGERCIPEIVVVNLKRIKRINKKNVDDFIQSKKCTIDKKTLQNHVVDTSRGRCSTPQTGSKRKSGWAVQFQSFDKSRSLVRMKKYLVNGKPWYENTPIYEPISATELCMPVLEDKKPTVIPEGQKPPVRVLSLFDGIGCGIVALKKLGIEIEVYYASEIDEDAINVVNMNHAGSVMLHHLGDVNNITMQTLKDISPINLLIGGSPCNDLSSVNHARKGLTDQSGTGVLFFQYYRILNSLEMINKDSGIKLYWLYENVASMENEYREGINNFLGIKGVIIDAANYSPQKRSRLYWGNIPGLQDIPNQELPATASYSLQSVLTPNCKRMATSVYSSTITTNPVTLYQGVVMGDKLSSLWINEVELLFGLPEHYTDLGLSPSERQCLIGRGWSVPVICKILQPLREIFLTRE